MSGGSPSYHSTTITVYDDENYIAVIRESSSEESRPGNKPSYEAKSNGSHIPKITTVSNITQGAPIVCGHLFATILEDVLTDLRILGECNNAMRNYKTQYDMAKLRRKKFGVQPSVNEEELSEIDAKDVENDYYKLRKYIADRELCNTVLSNTYVELALNKTFEALTKYREAEEERLDAFLFLIDEEARNRELRHDMKKQLRQQRNRLKSTIYETNMFIDQLNSRLEDAWEITNVEERYLNRWENSRSEQNNLRIQNAVTKSSYTIEKYNSKVDDEQRIHTEIETIISITLNDTLKQIEKCMAKYEEDTEAMEYKIGLTRGNYESKLQARLEMEQRLADHEVEMNKWIEFKKERQDAKDYEIKMETAAIIVQAWWRGILVRLELGPYKPSKRKTKKKKKK